MKKYILFSLLCITSVTVLFAQPPSQERTELEKERQQLQKELKDIQGVYDKVKGQSKQALGQLGAINKKINLQERYIGTINKEIKLIEDELYLSNLEIYRLQKQLDTLKSEYARTVVYAYKNRSSYDYLNFIFSATSFNDAVKRITYLKSYRTYRQKQVSTILETQELIAKRKQQQVARKDQQGVALQNQTKERAELDVQRKEKDAVVGKLKAQEKDLKNQIATKKKKDRDLQNAITAIIRRIQKEEEDRAKAAIAKKKADEEKNKPVATPGNMDVTVTTPNKGTATKPAVKEVPEKKINYLEYDANDIALGKDFTSSRGRLPWPVDKGYTKIHFGTYKIDGTPLQGDNPGITIGTQIGASVKAVFAGEVVGVFNIGDGMVVTIKHGKYFTTYSNLTGVSVQKGSNVTTGQVIGKAGQDEEGEGQIDFILMIEKNNVNPESWLKR